MLTILDTILDEEIRTPATGTSDEHDTAVTAALQAAIDAVTDPADFGSSPTGFPQFAERSDFVSSTNDPAVTNYYLSMNADGDPFPTSGAGVASGLYVGSTEIFLYGTADEDVVIGRLGGETGDIALVLVIEETKDGSGFVTQADMWTGIYYPLTHTGEDDVDSDDELDLDDLVFLTSEFDTTTEVNFNDFSDVPSGNPDFNVIFPDSDPPADVQLLTTGSEDGDQSTVNISTQGIGAGAQHVENGATLRIDCVSGMTQSLVDDNNELVPSAIDYTAHVDIIRASFEITQVNPGNPNARADLTVYAFQVDDDEPQEQAYLDDANSDDGDPVTILVADVKIFLGTTDVTATFGGTITQLGDGVKITGLDDGHIVRFTTGGAEFDRVLITNVDSKETFDIGNITVTALQGGEDSETKELGNQLLFQDDGPLIERNSEIAPALTVDETDFSTDDSDDFSGLFDKDFGADAAGDVAYTLEINGGDGTPSGLTETDSGNGVFLFLESGDIVGREGTSALDAETGDEVFRISVDGDGNVELDQSKAVVHGDPDDPDEPSDAMAASLIRLVATIDDGEADASDDTDSDYADIGDSFVFYDDGPDIEDGSEDDLFVDNTAVDKDDVGQLVIDGGNDPDANMTIIDAPDSNGFTYTFDDADNDSITGQLDGEDLYTLVVNDDGSYTFTLTRELPPEEDSLNVNEIKAGGPDTNFIDVGTTDSDDYCKLEGFDGTGAPAAINESNANVGVKNGNLDNGESIVFTLWQEDGAIDTQLFFLGLNIGTKSAKASEYKVSIDFVDPNTPDIVDDVYLVGKNETLEINPELGLIRSITIEKLSGPALKLGLGDIDILRPPGDVELNFELMLEDGDFDHDEVSFTVQIDGDGDGNITSPLIA